MSVSAARPGHIPGEAGIWVFVLGDMTVFALFFFVFAQARSQNPEAFEASRTLLNGTLGGINTVLLLTSSWFVALATEQARAGHGRPALLYSLAAACGAGFAVVKLMEYREKLSIGIGLTHDDFFMYYYIFTGLHFAHVLIGMVVLLCMINIARKGGRSPAQIAILEGGSSYWHMVDVLWVVLFALLYLIG